jgi:hypothetical protein
MKEPMSGTEITTGHMLFSLVVSLLSATDHVFHFVPPNYRPTIIYAKYGS